MEVIYSKCPFYHKDRKNTTTPLVNKIKNKYGSETVYAVRCYVCNAEGPIGYTKQEAVDLWDSREGSPDFWSDEEKSLQSE